MEPKKLLRSENRMLAGVCAGIGEYMSIDPTVVRVLFAALTLFSAAFPGVILYILLILLIPNKPSGPVDFQEYEEIK